MNIEFIPARMTLRFRLIVALMVASLSWANVGAAEVSEFPVVRQGVGLREALVLGSQHLVTTRSKLMAQSDSDLAEAARRRSAWPMVGVNAFAERTDTLLAIETPLGDLTSGQKSRGQLQIFLRQPLWRGSASLQAAADSLKAESSHLKAKQIADSRAVFAANLYLKLLALEASVMSTRSVEASYLSRFDRTRALLQAGRVLRSDLLKIQLELARTRQDIIRLEGQISIARRELGDAIGISGAFEVSPLKWLPSNLPIPDANGEGDALRNRSDMLAFATEIQSFSKSADAIQAEDFQPTVDLLAQHFDRDGVGFSPKRENSISLQISIPIFNAGATGEKWRAKLGERDAAEVAYADRMRVITTELEGAKVSYSTAMQLRKLAVLAVEDAIQTLEMRRSLYDLGKITVDDLMLAESELARQRTLMKTSEIDAVRAWVEYQYILGRDMTSLNYGVDHAP